MIKEQDILSRFQSFQNVAGLDKDFFIMKIGKDDFPNKPIFNSLYQCCICLSGSVVSRVNLQEISHTPGTIAIILPNQFVEIQYISDDYKGILIAMSPEFFDNLGFHYSIRTANAVSINPIIRLENKELDALINYTEMAKNILARTRPFSKEILRHLTAALTYSMADSMIKTLPVNMSREEIVTHRFLELVSSNYHQWRKVTEYAAVLGLTPGYLSNIVKSITQKSAADWIDEHIMLEAKVLLSSSDLTVQQICHRLNFPNQSFFGKYFKRHSGQSPTQYRNDPNGTA